ncbi:peptide/nickel transport system permease protein [Sediminihabitans luteus]|uniref:Peptide/nickel transport system permease protein n=1 Tax=Sediminihabitans luteus TaxID=1138585 RepID=A0A2M9D097_9CELL|nr:ABC transporter permease [Sediminihabitans luteus]PJJ77612.1 peptide/nickel transport system permease protein [Sediminihabitans luteus]GII98512.1 hypothetical protein Slu03_08900 [Sediminihabitans luteus]
MPEDIRTELTVPETAASGDTVPEVPTASAREAVGVARTVEVASSPSPTSPTPPRAVPRFALPRFSGKLVVGLVLVIGVVLLGLVGPFFTQDPANTENPAMLPPGGDHLLGTTALGYDVLAQLAIGTRASLWVGLLAGSIAVVLSLVFGIVAGYRAGMTDEVLSFVTNVMLVIPGLPLVIVISAFLEVRSMLVVAVVLGLTSWSGSAVILRMQAKSLRNRDYVSAARVAGEKAPRIIAVEILPNLLPLLTAQFLFGVILAILAEAGLSYLGLGPSGSVTLGTMLNEAQAGSALSRGAWWWFIPPGLVIALFGCGLSLINFTIDEIINPKLRIAPAAQRNVRKARRERDAQRSTEEAAA